jgi:hypothetical protein
MKPSRFPLYVWLGALPFFTAHIWLTSRELPARVATHFNAAGEPDAWMTRDNHVASLIALGLGMSAFIIGLCYAMRWFPNARLSVPNQALWQKPAHRPAALAFIFHHAFWLGTWALVFIAAVNHFIVAANRPEAATLANRGLLITAGLFTAGILAWIFILVRFFQKAPPR